MGHNPAMSAIPVPAPRLFLALWPDDAVRTGLAQWRDRWHWPAGASPVRTEQLHLTLHFIGPVAADRLAELGAALALPCPDFALEFGQAELWPHGVAIVCPQSCPPVLQQLYLDLAVALRGLALPVEERPFRPHVTLGRRARGAAVPADGPRVRWDVTQGHALVQSLPGGQGYQVLQRFRP